MCPEPCPQTQIPKVWGGRWEPAPLTGDPGDSEAGGFRRMGGRVLGEEEWPPAAEKELCMLKAHFWALNRPKQVRGREDCLE